MSDHANTIQGFFGDANNRYWIGLNDIANEGSFIYNSDQSSISWENWIDGQPNNGQGGQDCVAANDNGEWDDVKCHSLRYFVCEKGNIQVHIIYFKADRLGNLKMIFSCLQFL